MADMFRIVCGLVTEMVEGGAAALARADELFASSGQAPSIVKVAAPAVPAMAPSAPVVATAPVLTPPPWVGYETQDKRKKEHDCAGLVRDVADVGILAIRNEGRQDREMSAKELGDAITVNGKIRAFDLALTEHAIRGLFARIESPAWSYLMGLKRRMAESLAKGDTKAMSEDRAKAAEILRFECLRNPDVSLKLRTRTNPGDVFAVVSPTYANADAPEVLPDVLRGLPGDARGSWSYDPTTTAWELRADVWTPTPVAEQAVGEAFRGYVSYQSRDNGTGGLGGGGGVEILACLNASTYMANGVEAKRVHRGRILLDVSKMTRAAMKSIDALCAAWGRAREQTIGAPSGLTIEDAIPGFWRHLLTSRASELAAVLPGRTETHVRALGEAYASERRDRSRVVSADFAQGWTKYIQRQDAPVRREAESAIASWLVRGAPMGHVGVTS